MSKSSDYWEERFKQIEESSNAYGQETYRQIEPAFDQAQRQIQGEIEAWYGRFAINNNISMHEARRLLNSKELEELKWDVDEYIKYGRENALNEKWIKELENASCRFHVSRLEALKIRTQQAAEVAFGNELDAIDKMARRVFTEDYYQSIYEIQKGFNIGWDVARIDERKLNTLISKPWAADGKNFSQRIWHQKSQLINELHNQLTRACILGKAPDEAINEIARKFRTTKHQASRLVMTEQAYFHSVAQKEAFNELDVEEYEIVATLDSHTSQICREMDGKHFPMSDYKEGVTAPPFHVFCRSVTVPWFEDNFNGQRAARGEDGKTYYVSDSMTYEEWRKSLVDGGSKDDLTLISDSDLESELGTFKKKIIDSEGMKKEYYNALKDKFSHGTDDAKRVFNKYVPNDSVVNYMYEGTPEYRNGKIKMHYGVDFNNPRGVCVTWYHEHGHLIDDLAGNASNDARFVNALYKDFIDATLGMEYNEIGKKFVDMRTQSAVSDLFNGLSKDRIIGVAIHPLRLDGSSYWTEETIRQEAFAHMFECQFDKLRYQEMKKYFPNALDEFERILKGL